MSPVLETLMLIVQDPQNQEKMLRFCKPAWNPKGFYLESRERVLHQYFQDQRFDALAISLEIPFTRWMLETKVPFSEEAFWVWYAGH